MFIGPVARIAYPLSLQHGVRVKDMYGLEELIVQGS